MPTAEIVINSVNGMKRYGHRLSVHCVAWGCHHRADVDLDLIAKRIGADTKFLAPDIKHFFKCAQCGSKDVSFTISPNLAANGWPGVGA